MSLDPSNPSNPCPTLTDPEWQDLAALLELSVGERPASWRPLGVQLRRVPQGRTLFHQGSATGVVHVVRNGSFKTFRNAEDGYEQVLGFAWRKDVLGLDGLCEGRHASSAQALEDAQVYAISLNDLLALNHSGCAAGPALRALSRQLGHADDATEILSAVSAESRLARFLLRLSDRMLACGQSPRRLRLTMGRRDIASHLGLAHETVSRTLGLLATAGCIGVQGREITLLARDLLEAMAQATRSPVDRKRAGGAAWSQPAWHIADGAMRKSSARPVALAA